MVAGTLVQASISPPWNYHNNSTRTLIITDEETALSSIRISCAKPKNRAAMKGWDQPSSSSSSSSCDPPTVLCFRSRTQLRAYLFLCFGLLLCSSFVLAIFTADSHNSNRASISAGHYARDGASSVQRNDLIESGKGSMMKNASQSSIDGSNYNTMSIEAAYRGLGTIFRKGTRAMEELIVVNLQEQLDIKEFRLFLRTLHHRSVLATADLVLLSPWSHPMLQSLFDVFQEEEEKFRALLAGNDSSVPSSLRTAGANGLTRVGPRGARMSRSANRNRASIIWGSTSTIVNSEETLLDNSWGSVVGFQMSELDPANVLSEFVSNPSSQLRRWVCYQMLLGVLQRKFHRVLLVELGGVAILGDVFQPIRTRDGLYLTLEDGTWADTSMQCSHQGQQPHELVQSLSLHAVTFNGMVDINQRGKIKHEENPTSSTLPDKCSMMEAVYGKELWGVLDTTEKGNRVVSSRVIMGSMRYVKGLANSMVTEIVRVAMSQGRSSSHGFPDKALLSYLLQRSPSLLGKRLSDSLHIVSNEESMVHCVDAPKQKEAFLRSKQREKYSIVHGNSLLSPPFGLDHQSSHSSTVGDAIMADICASRAHLAIYPDCTRDVTL